MPSMTDDRLKYSCLVHNRAISKENASEAEVLLSVYCKCRFSSWSLLVAVAIFF